MVDFAPILQRWEKLRIAYNVVLVSVVLLATLLCYPWNVAHPRYFFSLALGGMIANLCYFTGPAMEAYGTYFGFWNRIFTYVLFLAGLAFTALLALICVVGYFRPL